MMGRMMKPTRWFAPVFGLLALLPKTSSADFFRGEYLYQQAIQKQLSVELAFPNITQNAPHDSLGDGVIDQKLDPSNSSDTRTFKQRYFINSEYASGTNAPVIYVICGESVCSDGNLTGAAMDTAKRIGAYLVALEHRYYGQSLPFDQLTADNMKYLRVDFALADLESFQKYAQNTLGLHGKWLTMGGSYSGVLSAYYRMLHPDLVVGALASSAPVHIQLNFENFDLSIDQTAGPRCANAMRAVVHQVEAALDQPEQLAKLKSTFGASDVDDADDFLGVVADMGAYAMQYGMQEQFCNSISNSSTQLDGYARAGQKIMSYFSITPFQDSYQGIESTNASDYSGFGARQWVYQTCAELGYWQIAYHDPSQSVRSQRLNSDFYARECSKIFGTPVPDTVALDTRYYEPLLQASTSKILFTDGSQDPWSKLSITHEAGNDTNPGDSYYTIQGGSHCSDFGPKQFGESSSLSHAREEFQDLVNQWL